MHTYSSAYVELPTRILTDIWHSTDFQSPVNIGTSSTELEVSGCTTRVPDSNIWSLNRITFLILLGGSTLNLKDTHFILKSGY